jgi:hypothetical protein
MYAYCELERYVVIFDEETKVVVSSVQHASRGANNRQYMENLWDPTEVRPDHVILLGDSNDVNGKWCKSMQMWGKLVTLRNFDETNYPFHGKLCLLVRW